MLILVAIVFCENRRAISIRTVGIALLLQATIAALALTTDGGKAVLSAVSGAVSKLIDYGNVGISFVFGPLGDATPLRDSDLSGVILAIQVLPVIIFVSALVAVLYHMRIMQLIIMTVGGGLRFLTGISKLEAVSTIANVFVGMIEAPLTIRPYINHLSRSQLFAVMCVGLSTVAGSILVGYASLPGGPSLDYLITAAFMAAPGGIVMSKLLIPETENAYEPSREALEELAGEDKAVNVIEAAANGAAAGLQIALTVTGTLIAFVALIALLNGLTMGFGELIGYPNLTVELILGYAFAPIAFLLGIPWEDAFKAGGLLAQKTILNEFLAYVNFSQIKEEFSVQSQAVLTIALCGFANLSALAIMLGGLGSIAPERKPDIARMGLKAILAGTLANFMSAALASTFLTLSGV